MLFTLTLLSLFLWQAKRPSIGMRILHLTKYYPPQLGGIEIATFDIVEGINEKGIRSDVLCANTTNKTVVENNSNHTIYRTSTLYSAFSTSFSSSLISTLNKIKSQYDIIQVHMPNPMAMLAVFLTRPKATIILHWHNDIIRQKQLYFFIKPLERWLLRKAVAIVGTSQQYLDTSVPLQPFLEKSIAIPLGIDTNRLIINEKRLAEIKAEYQGKKIVFSLGRLIYYKSFDVLIDAAKYLEDDTMILIGGIGKLKDQLAEQIVQNNLSHKVKLLGRISDEDMACYYQLCDVFCLSSSKRAEGFGLVLLEAMYFGKPLVSTNILGSGSTWINQHEQTGYIVPINNSEAIATAVKDILKDPVKYARFSKNAKERFNQYFTKNFMIDTFEKLYRKVVK